MKATNPSAFMFVERRWRRVLYTLVLCNILFMMFTPLLQSEVTDLFIAFVAIIVLGFLIFLPLMIAIWSDRRKTTIKKREREETERRQAMREIDRRKRESEEEERARVRKEQEEKKRQEFPWLFDGTPDGGQPDSPLHIRRWIKIKQDEAATSIEDLKYVEALSNLDYIIDRMKCRFEDLKELGPESSTELMTEIEEARYLCSAKHASHEARISLERIDIKPNDSSFNWDIPHEVLELRISKANDSIGYLETLAKNHQLLNFISHVVAYREQLKENITKAKQIIYEQQETRITLEPILVKAAKAVTESWKNDIKLRDRIQLLSEVLVTLRSFENPEGHYPSNDETYTNAVSLLENRLAKLKEIDDEFGIPGGIIPDSLNIDEAEITIKGIVIEANLFLTENDRSQSTSLDQMQKLAAIKGDIIRAHRIAEKFSLSSYKEQIMDLLRKINEILEE